VAADLTPARGRLLVAAPDLSDPNFDGTVVLVLEHDDEGTVGVILNRPSPLEVDEAMAGPPGGVGGRSWDDLASPPAQVFVGGPVQPNAVIALARVRGVADPELFEPVGGSVGVIRIGEGPVPTALDLASLRIFAGYAGWGAGQLAGELEAGAWFVVDGEDDDGFAPDPEQLWWRVLRRQGGIFTTATDQPALN
jgi:putative transcriptional regulator